MSDNSFALHGAVAYSVNPNTIVCEPDAYVISVNGYSEGIFTELPEEFRDIEVTDAWDKLIIPGLIDLKSCAPEYQIRGMGVAGSSSEQFRQSAEAESRLYADENYAERAYDLFVEDLLVGATTRTIVSAPMMEESADLLADMLEDAGIIFGIGEADGMVQCPTEELNFANAFSPVRSWITGGVQAGLGSGMGDDISMLKVMKAALQVSGIRAHFLNDDTQCLTLEEVFYLATKGGGSFFGECGSFEKGYQFDAVILDDGNQDTMRSLSVRDRLERMIYLSDERNIDGKYIFGEKLY